MLGKAFSRFASISDAEVIVDGATGRSRGYGFLSFRDKIDAEKAISTMNGRMLNNRPMRVDWSYGNTQGKLLSQIRAIMLH